MKHPTKDPTQAEQEAAFAAEYEQRNAGLNGRHKEKAARKRYARRPGPPKHFRGILPGSGRGKLLQAAASLPDPFGLSALVLMAWAHFPETFGLPGIEREHPSDNAVRCCLYGKRGLLARGLLKKSGANLFSLTSLGKMTGPDQES